MTAFADQPAPQPQPRRDEYGVPWCSRQCGAYDEAEAGYYYDRRREAQCIMDGLRLVESGSSWCQPAARADAAELVALRYEVARLLEVEKACRVAQAEVARLKHRLHLLSERALDAAYILRGAVTTHGDGTPGDAPEGGKG